MSTTNIPQTGLPGGFLGHIGVGLLALWAGDSHIHKDGGGTSACARLSALGRAWAGVLGGFEWLSGSSVHPIAGMIWG